MVDTPCFFACCSIAAPAALSRLPIASPVTPPVIICCAMVCIFCASFCAFWMSYLTPAALNADSSLGRSWLSHRGEDVVSGRITPPLRAAAPPPPLLLLELLELPPPQAVSASKAAAVQAVARVRRRTMIGPCHFVGDTEKRWRTSWPRPDCDRKHSSHGLSGP